MFIVAYIIIGRTVLSVCAISTNGALDAGGAYYMISHALGPEFGGSIGIMFFLTNVCGSALFMLGLVESIMDTFGVPQAKISPPPGSQVQFQNAARGNWKPIGSGRFTVSLLFTATLNQFLIYLFFSRLLLQRDYSFLRDINVWHPFVTIGVYSSTLSAAMSNLIGASRILYAMARDDLFGKVLAPAKMMSCSGNLWAVVLISWFLVQLVLFSGKLNTIAGIVAIFFMLVYAAMDLACLALEWASAPNFRVQLSFGDTGGESPLTAPEEKLQQLLRELRIKADIHTVAWDSVVALHWHKQAGRKPEEELELEEEDFENSFPSNATRISDDYLQAINRMILQQASELAVRFLYLPRPPADTSLYHTYLRHLDIMTKDLGPTLLIHRVTPITNTHL
ncbi:Solute carrier family 12 member 9 [Acipenser ruthenus]|uniref:Solute carrier family 12 member 9 n=1 Tax=Acipenser ruthenus TaxID=7906 RepID=A0A444U298_ACIRT|nr:Solute carrier family 12 member 9 [Acipenser ruthenus]